MSIFKDITPSAVTKLGGTGVSSGGAVNTRVFTDIPTNPLPQPQPVLNNPILNNIRTISAGNGNQVFRFDQQGIWLGAEDFADAPFSVTMAGAITAPSLAVSQINIGGDDATSAHIDTDGNQWWGASVANKATAPARISNAGVLTATGVTIAGALTTAAGSSINGTYITAASIIGSAIALATITAANITNATITATQIATGTITSNEIANATITGTDIAAATIAAGNIVSGTITATQIAAATITAANIVTGTITGTQIASATIAAGNIVSGTITGTQIASATIAAGNIVNATITGTQIAATTIAAGNIVSGTITTTQISATAGIVGGQIAAATILGGNIGATTIAAANIANLTITAAQIANLTITSGKVNTALMSYSHNLVFSFTGDTQVNWATGTLTTSDGTAYTIAAGNTGVMAAKTYVYLDTAVSVTVLQTTTTFSTAVGDGKMLIAVAQNNTTEAVFQVFNGIGGTNLAGGNIVAGSITANEIAATTITASLIAAGTITATQIAASTITSGLMSVSQLSAISADMGAITAGTITLDSSGNIKSGQTAYETGTGWFIGYSGGTSKLSMGSSTNYIKWDGTYLKLKGSFDVGSGGLINNSVYTVANLPVVPTTVGFNVPSANE